MTAVVFDCDGVLVDSEPIAEAVWTEVLGRYGYRVAAGDFEYCLGRSRSDVYAYFAHRATLPGEAIIVANVDCLILPMIATQLEAFPDAVDTVRELALNGIPLAVASSSSRASLDAKLERVGLGRYFDATIAGDEVRRGKPAPDLFLGAAAELGMDARSCLAVEDSPAGADAAQAAGMRVVTVSRDGGAVGGRSSVDRLDAGLILTWLNR